MNYKMSSTALLVSIVAGSNAWAGHTNIVLEAEMDGREEVGDDPSKRLVGDPDGKGDAYVFGIDGDTTTLCYVLSVEKILLVPVGEGMAAHIHEGARDSNGPVVAALAGPEDGNAADCLTEGEAGKFPTQESGIVQRILQNPESFYVNVHNPSFPGGAVRGQLKNQIHDDSMNESVTNAPTIPMNVTATVYSSSALELFWDRSTDDVAVVGYNVYRDDQLLSSAQGNSFFDDSLKPATSYEYSVVAIDNLANESGRSESVVVTTND